jgi:hypothetical protein
MNQDNNSAAKTIISPPRAILKQIFAYHLISCSLFAPYYRHDKMLSRDAPGISYPAASSMIEVGHANMKTGIVVLKNTLSL